MAEDAGTDRCAVCGKPYPLAMLRLHAENDYKVNLKAEIEIRHLHDKIDTQLMRQWERLTAIQRLQLELLEETTRGAQEEGQG